MSQYNPQWAHPPQQNQPQPPKKSNVGKVIGIVAGFVVTALVFLFLGTGIGMSGEPTAGPTVTVTETAKPESAPTKTVTAKPKPAPTVTVTARPDSDEPATPEETEPVSGVTSVYDIEQDYNGCTWVTQLDDGNQQVVYSEDCMIAVAYSDTEGLALVAMRDAAKNNAGFGYIVYMDNWAAYVTNSDDSAALSSRYGATVEEV